METSKKKNLKTTRVHDRWERIKIGDGSSTKVEGERKF